MSISSYQPKTVRNHFWSLTRDPHFYTRCDKIFTKTYKRKFSVILSNFGILLLRKIIISDSNSMFDKKSVTNSKDQSCTDTEGCWTQELISQLFLDCSERPFFMFLFELILNWNSDFMGTQILIILSFFSFFSFSGFRPRLNKLRFFMTVLSPWIPVFSLKIYVMVYCNI